MTTDDLAFDQRHIWHLHTSMTPPSPVCLVAHAKGCKLTLVNGEKLIDGMSSWWAAIHGHNHPQLNATMKTQIDAMSHIMLGGIIHAPVIVLRRQLVAMTPEALEHASLVDSELIAVEAAMKMVLQHWQAKGEPHRHFPTSHNGYHGDTLGAMSIRDPDNSTCSLWKGYLPEDLFAPAPQGRVGGEWDELDMMSPARLMVAHHHEIVIVVLGPIVRGVGGMRMYHSRQLKRVRKMCDREEILLIADEIAAGFGHTGKSFAREHASIIPDILRLGKALTGGITILSATLTIRQVVETISSGETGCFTYSPTSMGNPLACAVASTSLSLTETDGWYARIAAIGARLWAELAPVADSHWVADVRVFDAIGIVEIAHLVNMAALQKFSVEQSMWIRPFDKPIYLMSPYIIQSDQLHRPIQVVDKAARNVTFFSD